MKLLVISDSSSERHKEFMARAAQLNDFIETRFAGHAEAESVIKEYNPGYILVYEYSEEDAEKGFGYLTFKKIQQYKYKKILRCGEGYYSYPDYINYNTSFFHELFDRLLDRGNESSIENIE